MLCRLLLSLIGMVLVFGGVSSTFAADKPDPCQSVYEEIVPLRVPDFNQAAVWKRTTGVKGMDRPRAVLGIKDGGQIVIGTATPYDEKTGLSAPVLSMMRTNPAGRVVIDKTAPVKNLQSVVDAVVMKDRIAVLSHIGKGDDYIDITFINGAGDVKSSNTISDKQARLIPKGFVMGDGNMIIAAEAVSRKNADDSYTMLLWADKDGKFIKSRDYLPGVKNKPESLLRLNNGELLLTGRVAAGDGRTAGWVARLSAKGDILYQRPFARGGDSVLRRATQMDNGNVIVVGDAVPSTGTGSKAGWIMRLDNNGNIIWQKYITGKYAYSGVDVVTLDDGRVTVALAGRPSGDGGRQHARLETLTAEGLMTNDESFIEGSNALPLRLLVQDGRRYLLGMAETGFTKKDVAEDLKLIGYDSWLVNLAALAPYTVTCAGGMSHPVDDPE